MAKRIMSLLVIMIMMISLLCGSVLATEVEVVINPATVIDGTSAGATVVEVNKDIIANGCDGAIYAKNGANVLITGGKVHGQLCTVDHKPEDETNPLCGYSMAVWSATGSIVTIAGGDFTHDPDTVNDPSHDDLIYASGGGSITITGGTFTCQTPKWTLNCKDGSGSIITVKGGRFYKFNPATAGVSGSANYVGAGEVVVPEGYEVVQDGDWFEVVKSKETIFREAIAYGGIITLENDVELTKLVTIEKNVTIKLNGHNITRSTENGKAAALYVNHPEATLTIEGEGNVSAYGPVVWVNAGKAVLKGGAYTSNLSHAAYAQGTGHIDVENGKYIGGIKEGEKFVLNIYDSDRATASIKVTGGTFVDWDPSKNAAEGPNTNFVAEEYKAVANGSNYVVVCAHKSLAGYPLKEATYVEDGCQPYYECNNCHKLFMDAAATKEVANKADLVIPKLLEIKGTEAIVTDAAVMGAIQKAEDSTVVELPVLEANKTVKEVTVPIASVEAVADQDKGLLIETSDVTVTLDAKTVATVAEEAKDATKVTIEVIKEETKVLNTAQKEAVKDKKVEVVISAKILADGKEISDFKGGKVTVEIPFKPAEGLNASDYKFVYIDDNGKVTEIPSKYFDGVMVVELEHFSEYAIVREEKKETTSGEATSTPAPAPAPAAPVKDNTPKTGAISVIGLVSAMAVGGLVITRKRK